MARSNKNIQNLKDELISLIQAKQFKKAEKLYPQYKNKKIHDVDVWQYFAGIHSERGNTSELVYCCKKILEITPNDSKTAYNLGACLQNLNHLDEAIQQYENCIRINPSHTSALINCAHIYYVIGDLTKSANYCSRVLESNDIPKNRIQYAQTLTALGEHKSAIQQLNYTLAKEPTNKKALFLIAQCNYELRDYIDSEKFYLQLLSLDNKNIQALNNLGRLYEETGQLQLSAQKYREAIKINADIYTTHFNLGKVLAKIGELDGAEKELLKSIELEPDNAEIYLSLGKIYNELHNSDKAKRYFTIAQEKTIPDYIEKKEVFEKTLKYYLSTTEQPNCFNDDKKEFIADLFDKYSDTFDSHLVNELDYNVPELINDLLAKHLLKKVDFSIDLGCGTGLCCQYLKSYSNHITGVDISPKMIEIAHIKKCYDNLIIGEVSEVMNSSKTRFNLAVSADVFIYIGDLDTIFKACDRNMKDNGYFIFSTETLLNDTKKGYSQYDSGRYKHSISYIEELSILYGFNVLEHQECNIRKEYGTHIKGHITLLQKI